ncbi:sigma-E factor negative regulatory protein [Massilia litorea]|uniref:Sigma-E factor negative regulatory protein n=1 Tax=Massilia litorea TaxID=2769491 RepID=A0A7L9UDJ7_9BURK|nr:sigma-E factor negative regulatory protein [Massilia litorea]QOL52245.1 sigma-E factor negative regulatory protein [Massilia litorea]
MDENRKNRERISAFSDGALSTEDHILAQLALRTPEGTEAWEVYRLIGHVMRTSVCFQLSLEFAARMRSRLAAELLPVHSLTSEFEAAKSVMVGDHVTLR